jgi:hypothetical protein
MDANTGNFSFFNQQGQFMRVAGDATSQVMIGTSTVSGTNKLQVVGSTLLANGTSTTLTCTGSLVVNNSTNQAVTINAGIGVALGMTGYCSISNPPGQALLVKGWSSFDASAGGSTALTVKGNGLGNSLYVTDGNLTCTGDIVAGKNIQATSIGINAGVVRCNTLEAAGKTFDIPRPVSAGMRLRHRCMESDQARLYYEFTLQCEAGLNIQELPGWFGSMNSACRVYCAPVEHFGAAWGKVADGELQVTSNASGTFNVLLTGIRSDPYAVDEWAHYGVEYPDPNAPPEESAL